jgi:uncharacterized membrane protein YgaE (UPF0421/DUF939 family)
MIDGTLLSFLIGAVVGTVLMALVIIPVVVKLKNDHAELEAENKRLSAASKRSLEAYTVIFDERTQLGE